METTAQQAVKASLRLNGTTHVNQCDPVLTELKKSKAFGGYQASYSHRSCFTKSVMKFSIYLPPLAETEKVPVLYFLPGWQCDENTFPERSGMQPYACEHGIAVVSADTSPRFTEDSPEELRTGEGASFYLNATEPSYKDHFQMLSYVTEELPAVINKHFPVLPGRKSIMGHSMGGHGALILFLKTPGKYCSVSAFAPPCHPTSNRLANMVFKKYLGDDPEVWKEYDSTELVSKYDGPKVKILIDQGLADRYYKDGTMQPEAFEEACQKAGYPLQLNYREGYGHSYYFLSTFVMEHFQHHARFLKD